MFTAIFVSLFFALWLTCGALVWLAASVITRGEAGLVTLPLAMFAGAVGGLAVPYLISDDGLGLWLSVLAAIVLSAMVVGARALSRGALADESPASKDVEVGL